MRSIGRSAPGDINPEMLKDFADRAAELAGRPGGDPAENAIIASTGMVTASAAALLDRLDRIILLLDERLPARRGGEDPLAGTVEGRP